MYLVRAEVKFLALDIVMAGEMQNSRRTELDVILKGLTPKHQRQLSVSTSNALEMFPVLEVRGTVTIRT